MALPPPPSVTSLIARTRRLLRRRFTREVAQHSSHSPDVLRALYVLAEEEEIQNQSTLAARLDLDAPAASRLVACLLNEGLIARETGLDRRCRTLRITDRGHEVLIPARVALQRVDGDLEEVLGVRQTETLRRMLARVVDAFDEDRSGARAAGGGPVSPYPEGD